MKILMLAAENGALPHGKVGGMGDVIRDLPRALTTLGHTVTVLTPGYGIFSSLPGAQRLRTISVPFGGTTEHVEWYRLPGDVHGLAHEFLEHPRFSPHGPGRIYEDDGDDAPFYSDATKFAFFGAAAAAAVEQTMPDVVHLHDWHTGFYFALRRFDRRFASLAKVRSVFTIHNLAMQGIRPYEETASSWHAWYPWLRCDREAVEDPVYRDCINPMAIALRHADMVNAVSPTYAREIVKPNAPAHGFHGGEGLEAVLSRAAKEGRLTGILNGCDYTGPRTRRPGWKKFVELLRTEVRAWAAAERHLRSAHYLALERLDEMPKRRPATLLTSVGRVTPQKSELFRETVDGSTSAIDSLLTGLDDSAMFVMVGSGDRGLERFLVEVATRHRNFLFLNGYSERIADALYASGDLFLMPSSFEPCGISQMLAMRAGQPCVVHGVGGLKDTVSSRTGFSFDGDTPLAQAQSFVAAVRAALAVRTEEGPRWKGLCAAAAAERFDWGRAARSYIKEAYEARRG